LAGLAIPSFESFFVKKSLVELLPQVGFLIFINPLIVSAIVDDNGSLETQILAVNGGFWLRKVAIVASPSVVSYASVY